MQTTAFATLAALSVFTAWMSRAPADTDYATTRMSDQGAYRVSYASQAAPIPINRMHAGTLRVETKDGQPVTNGRR